MGAYVGYALIAFCIVFFVTVAIIEEIHRKY